MARENKRRFPWKAARCRAFAGRGRLCRGSRCSRIPNGAGAERRASNALPAFDKQQAIHHSFGSQYGTGGSGGCVLSDSQGCGGDSLPSRFIDLSGLFQVGFSWQVDPIKKVTLRTWNKGSDFDFLKRNCVDSHNSFGLHSLRPRLFLSAVIPNRRMIMFPLLKRALVSFVFVVPTALYAGDYTYQQTTQITGGSLLKMMKTVGVFSSQ